MARVLYRDSVAIGLSCKSIPPPQCYVGELRFFNFRVEPVLTVSVETKDRGCVIRLLSCKLQGSRCGGAAERQPACCERHVLQKR